MARVELRPLPKKEAPWHGYTGEQSFKPDMRAQVLVDGASNTWATGLTEEETIEYSKLLGVDLSNKFDPDDVNCYWTSNSAMIKLKNSTVVYDTSKPKDFVTVAILKASKLVANSMKEWEEGLFPNATHVIDDEAAEMQRKASKIEAKEMALTYAMKMAVEEKCNIIQIITGKSVRGMSPSFVTVAIDEIITNNPLQFVKFAKMDKETTFLHALILEALYRNILTKEGNNICFMGDPIAFSEEECIAYLKDPNNQKLKATILGKMSAGRTPVTVPKEINDKNIENNIVKDTPNGKEKEKENVLEKEPTAPLEPAK